MNRAEWLEKQKTANAAEPYQFGKTTVDIFANILQSSLKTLEGIWDTGATVVGAVGGLFDKEFQADVKDYVKYDWLGDTIDLEKAAEGSLINFMGEKGQMITRGVAQGIGQMLPAVATNVVLPGAGLATLGVSATGASTEQAFQEGASFGKGATYGVLSGAVEMATEKLTGGFTKNVVGKGWLDDVIDSSLGKVAKTSVGKLALRFAEEGFEEMLATAIEPTLREVYQKGAIGETFTKEHAEQILTDGLIGGLTGIVFEGTINQIGKTSRSVTETAQDIKQIEERKAKLWEQGKLTPELEQRLDARIEGYKADLNKALPKLAEDKQKRLAQSFGLEIEDGRVKTYEAEEGFNKTAYSPALHGKESKLIYKPVKGEITSAQQEALKLHADLNKIAKVKTDIVIAEDLGTTPDGQKIGATFDKGVLYIDSHINDETLLKRKVVHETTHSLEQLLDKTAYRNFQKHVADALKENAEVRELLDRDGEAWAKTEKMYKSQLDGKTAFEQDYIITTELMAQFSEKLFTDEKVIKRLTRENRNVVEKIYNQIKDLIERWQERKGKTESEKQYLDFLHKAENLYRKALEESTGGVDLKTVRSIGEALEGKETESAEIDDARRGYVGYSRSERSQEAIENYEMPLSMIDGYVVDKFLKEIQNDYQDDMEYLKSLSAAQWKYAAQKAGAASWHHTGKFYAETDHYSLYEALDYIIENKNTFADDYAKYKQVQKKEAEAKKSNVKYAFIKVQEWGGTRSHPKIVGYDTQVGVVDGDWVKYQYGKYKKNANKVEKYEEYASLDALLAKHPEYANSKESLEELAKQTFGRFSLEPAAQDDSRKSIEDFGEKIGGARKDVWMKRGLYGEDLQYLNDAEADKYIKKDYVWKPMNYVKMAEEGLSRDLVYLHKLTRDSIPAKPYIRATLTKPERDRARELYVDTIQQIKNGVANVKTADDLKTLRQKVFIDSGYMEDLGGKFKTTSRFYENPALDVALFQNWGRAISDFQILQRLANKENVGLSKDQILPKGFSISERNDKYYIKYGYNVIGDVGFNSRQEAFDFVKEFEKTKLQNKKTAGKKRFIPKQLKSINRKGIDYRNGKNIIGKNYLDDFGFRGGEFGNWLNENDRQTSLNYGYDALMDLSDALNISRDGISLGGTLAIAFGARGQGLSGAVAHYEPERRVINLTKMNGAGSLAHEWFHALDHYIAGKESKELASTLFKRNLNEKSEKAFENLIHSMQYVERDQTGDETDTKIQNIYNRAKSNMEYYLKLNFRFLNYDESTAKIYRQKRVATDEDKKAYEKLSEQLLNGDQTALEKLNVLRKEITNKQIPKDDYLQMVSNSWSLDVETLKKQYGQSVKKVRIETDYFRQSQKFDKLYAKSGGYWASTEEMLARAFATFIQDKTNGNNDYLSAHAEAAINIDENGDVIYAYPRDEERATINKAFERFFEALKDEDYLKVFQGARPERIAEYKTDDKGTEEQQITLPLEQKKETPKPSVADEKPIEVIKGVKVQPRQLDLFSGTEVQLTLFGADERFSIISADDKIMYDEKEVKKAIEDAIFERMDFGQSGFGALDKLSEAEMMKMFAEQVESSKDKQAAAKKVAKFIVDSAVIENGFYADEIPQDIIKQYNVMKSYRGQFDLDSIRADVQHAFGKQTHIFAQWGKRKGQSGETPDVIAQELEKYGIYFDAINPADIFIKFVNLYNFYSDKIHGRNKEILKSVAQTQNGVIVDKIEAELADDILNIIENKGKDAPTKTVIADKKKQIKDLEKKNITLLGELNRLEAMTSETITSQAEKINELRTELYDNQREISRLHFETQDQKDFIRSLADTIRLARADIGAMKEKLRDDRIRFKATSKIFEQVQRIKNYKEMAADGIAKEVLQLIKALAPVKTWAGNISPSVRKIMRAYARQVDGVKLYDLLAKEENRFADAIEAIASEEDSKELSTAEIQDLANILANFAHDVQEYDRVFFEGRKESEKELATTLIEETGKAVAFKQDGLSKTWRKFDNWLQSPIWRFARLSNYDDKGLMSRMFWEFQRGVNKQNEFIMRTQKHFEAFFEKNRKLTSTWHDMVTINGKTMSRGQAMYLYLVSLREQGKLHLFNRMETHIEPNGMINVEQKGTVQVINDKIAEKNLRQAKDEAKRVEISAQFIAELKKQFSKEEKEFMNLAYVFFNKISSEAKIETDRVLYGVGGDLEPYYIPLRSAEDQIYKKVGDRTLMQDLFTVFDPSFNKKTNKFANNELVIENLMDVIYRHMKQMSVYYGLANPIKTFNRIWNAKTAAGTVKQAVSKADSGFERYVSNLLKDMQGTAMATESFDKFIAKVRSLGAKAALGANPKVWINQMVSLFAAHGVGFKYNNLFKGLIRAAKGKTDFDRLMELSPMLYARFTEGHNIDAGFLMEQRGLSGKVDKITELTLKPIGWMDKMMIGSIWNAALDQFNGDEQKAAKIVEQAVIITQANYTPLFRPEILRTKSSLLQLSTMFMSEPLQMFSQLFGSVDKIRVAKTLLKQAKTAEEKTHAEGLLQKAKTESTHAVSAVMVDMVLLTFIAQLFNWVKGKRDDDKTVVEEFGSEMLENYVGMFPFMRDIYSIVQGYDVTNMAYTGLTNIGKAGVEIAESFTSAVSGEYTDPVKRNAGIRKTLLGLSQTFGIPIRNLETYITGITGKFAPGAAATYDSWFWKESTSKYMEQIESALAKGQDGYADTLIDLMISGKLETQDKTVKAELARLYKTGNGVLPQIINATITHNGETIELTAKEHKAFVEVYQNAEKDIAEMLGERTYAKLTDVAKAATVKLIYDYYYNIAKSELVGEPTSNIIELAAQIPIRKLAPILAQAKEYTADKDEAGNPISGTKKLKIEQLMIGSYLTQAQKDALLKYLGYSI